MPKYTNHPAPRAAARRAELFLAHPLALLLTALLTSASAAAQGLPRLETLPSVSGDSMDRLRLRQLTTGETLNGYLLRSTSTLVGRSDSARSGWSVFMPQISVVSNSALPYSPNDGSLWAGRGISTLTRAGVGVRLGNFRVILAPELTTSANGFFKVPADDRFIGLPLPPSYRSPFSSVWHVRPYSADVPYRMGAKGFALLRPGQSSISYTTPYAEFGASTENEWWGPGIRNAIVLSNNAEGFPHLFLRTPRPLTNRLGTFEGRWLVGSLTESRYFDFDSSNNTRSYAALALTWRPTWQPTLTLGASRAVYGTASGMGSAATRWLDVFRNTGHPDERPYGDSTLTPGGRDQIISFFGRWVFPNDGFETYAEWARLELPKSLKDFLIAPNQSQGYTLGLQWARDIRSTGKLRLQAEVTTLEQSSAFRDRPQGSFYSSRRVIQGYTNRGQVLGAAIGPGASGQWLALDWLFPSWSAGAYAARVRTDEDAHSNYGFPRYVASCNHDVSLLPGFRAAKLSRFGFVSAELTLGNRLNAFFQNQSGCQPKSPSRLDVRNRTISITFSPMGGRP